MPTIAPFRALRYDLKHVGSLSNVICPPYDVIDPELQNRLYKQHPANIVRLELNRDEPGDNDANNRYTRAAKFLKNWRSEGVLYEEPQPAVYVYHQEFESRRQNAHPPRLHGPLPAGAVRRRQNLSARGNAFRPEARSPAAHPGLPRESEPDLRPVPGRNQRRPETCSKGRGRDATPVEATDHLGVVHRMWTITDAARDLASSSA